MQTITAFFREIDTKVTADKIRTVLNFILILLAVYIFFKILNSAVKRITVKKCSPQMQHIIDKIIKYTSTAVIILTAFNRLGINASAILGAAGIAGIAVGFAAQASISNIISGLFIITERAFKINDIIEINGTIGTVQSINLLSVVLKTFDNQYVRIPNETIVKANLINYSHFPYRRIKTDLSVPHGTDLRKLESILSLAARRNEFTLADPAPSVLWTSYSDSGINLTLNTWTKNENFVNARNSIFIETSELFKQEGIKIPFKQVDIHIKESSKNPGSFLETPAEQTRILF